MINLKTIVSWTIFTILPLFVSFYFYSGTVKTVIRIIDGDTIYFDERYKCRLSLIDAPESQINDKLMRDRSSCQDISESKFIEAGLLSKKFLESLIPLGSEAKVYILDVDKYKRNICKVVLLDSQKDVSEELVYSGYAIPFFRFISSNNKTQWINLVMSAKTNNKGLWSDYSDVMNCMMSDIVKN